MYRKIFLPLTLIFLAAGTAGIAADGTTVSPSNCYPPLSLVTTSLPSTTAGSHYSVHLSANGGQPPYHWSFGQSSLPSGFSISPQGKLTGTANSAGSYTFHVVVSDSLMNNVTGAWTLLVAPDPTEPTQPPPTQPPPTQPPPTQPPPTQPPPTQPPPTQPPPTQPPPTQPPPTQPPPTQPPPTQPPSGPPTGKALTACGDLTEGGNYYLANDVSSKGSCFGIDADNITLNLNGHTITYGTGGGTTPTPAIEGYDCWYTTGHFIGGYCGKTHSGLEVYGGNIVQSTNSAPFSSVFSFGQGTFNSAPYIHDITATFQNQGAEFYYSTFLPPGARIENNTIYDNVTNIQLPGQGILSARSAFQGQAIMIQNNDNQAGVGDTITGNKIIGSPQGGVRSNNQNTVIASNDISMNATYSNDFCADIPAEGQVVKNNNCHPKSGRGFHINAGNDTVTGNTITVTELKQNMEYASNGQPGCEGGGTYGIQVEDDAFQHNSPAGSMITNNTITAIAGDCDALGLRITSLTPTSGATFTGNTVRTSNNGGTGHDYAISTDAAAGNGVVMTGNTFQSQYGYVQLDWDGGNNLTIGNNTWLGTPTYLVDAEDGGCTSSDSLALCPASVKLIDSLSGTVKCYLGSTATVTVGSTVVACKPGQGNSYTQVP